MQKSSSRRDRRAETVKSTTSRLAENLGRRCTQSRQPRSCQTCESPCKASAAERSRSGISSQTESHANRQEALLSYRNCSRGPTTGRLNTGRENNVEVMTRMGPFSLREAKSQVSTTSVVSASTRWRVARKTKSWMLSMIINTESTEFTGSR
jgi:hypothetical protein